MAVKIKNQHKKALRVGQVPVMYVKNPSLPADVLLVTYVKNLNRYVVVVDLNQDLLEHARCVLNLKVHVVVAEQMLWMALDPTQ